MVSKVYFVSRRARAGHGQVDKMVKLIKKSELLKGISSTDLVGIKIHFGERGNTATIRPPFVGAMVEQIKSVGAKPFLTDTNTLYRGSRANAVDHLNTAVDNGYAYSTVKAPIIIADGLHGKDYRRVNVAGKHIQEANIGAAILDADALIVMSHFKGHELTGFGGVIKNMAMGFASRSGKLQQHSDIKPKVGDNCIACGLCLKWCPADAISLGEKALIETDKCIGCGECTVTCRHKAIGINWEIDSGLLQEKMAEYAYAGIKDKLTSGKAGFITFVTDVTPECDCCSWSDQPIVPDIGILASADPVALEQACLDLVNQTPGIHGSRWGEGLAKAEKDIENGLDKFRAVHPHVDGTIQIRRSESLGMGSRKYELIQLD